MGSDRDHEKTGHYHDLYKEQIFTEQVRQLYALAPIGFLATFMNSLIVFFVLKDVMR